MCCPNPPADAGTCARSLGDATAVDRRARIPRTTYRLQLGAGFTLADATAIVPYLARLGISDCYLSPLLQARRTSTHGYDVTDYGRIDPRIGTLDDLHALHAALRAHEMGLLLDVVPNHMGIGEGTNPWWMDVLEFGESSPYAHYFDIDWQADAPGMEHRVLLPILEDQYGAVLESGVLRVAYEQGAFCLRYRDRRLPLAPSTYAVVLDGALALLRDAGPPEVTDELGAIITALRALPGRGEPDGEKRAAGREWAQAAKERLAALLRRSADAERACAAAMEALAGRPGEPSSFDNLDDLLEGQYYRLASWRVAADEINYRRFFDITELAAVRAEAPEVFADTHRLVLDLVRQGVVSGLRIDHPDGLLRPRAYFRRLQDAVRGPQGDGDAAADSARPLFVVAEKILSEGETLDRSWPVFGTTGYDFLADVNGVLVNRSARWAFDRLYSAFTGANTPFGEVAIAMKKLVMLISFAGELQALGRHLDSIAARNRHYRDFTRNSLVFALREIIAALQVYRTYITPQSPPAPRDMAYVAEAVHEAKRRNPRTAASVFDFVGATMTLQNLDRFREDDRPDVGEFAERVQQITGPVMAKGVEDTAFYLYHRLVSLNEVGGTPERFGMSVAAFHRANAERAADWPHSLLATSTHDTKRSEDARARLTALTEYPSEWRAAVHRWATMNAGTKDEQAPDRNDEYLLYQALVSIWPSDLSQLPNVEERAVAYMRKATREAKAHTSWIEPNSRYEEETERFVRTILQRAQPFVADMTTFVRMITPAGYMNALSQTLIKVAAPGVPDFYQGTELWDFSLVDPDNRRPVDFAARIAALARIDDASPAELWRARDDGRLKLYVTARALRLRRHAPDVFERGRYIALTATGAHKDRVIAFARQHGRAWAICVAPRLLGGLMRNGELPVGPLWADTAVVLPSGAPRRWTDTITGAAADCTVAGARPALALRDVFSHLPVALLTPVAASGD